MLDSKPNEGILFNGELIGHFILRSCLRVAILIQYWGINRRYNMKKREYITREPVIIPVDDEKFIATPFWQIRAFSKNFECEVAIVL